MCGDVLKVFYFIKHTVLRTAFSLFYKVLNIEPRKRGGLNVNFCPRKSCQDHFAKYFFQKSLIPRKTTSQNSRDK